MGEAATLKDVLKVVICHHDQSGGKMGARWGKGRNRAIEVASHLIAKRATLGATEEEVS
jgi:hypothetical protein